ncbi:ATP-binding protein [Pengzhenrongella sicca]|uniref:ATP-binding protein n=1 Tax=Pengzhenrongella sicca TaxID=2819238 RepID=A0A8A4ZN58_9MICO|nr:ATP-binding protein [Pengzhenrongella sicca]QTE30988.1 ATP-binding protein [Pengzhenrongella sicca]
MSLQLTADTKSIAFGRNWVASVAIDSGAPTDRVSVIKLLSGELITNAILHGPPGGAVTVRTFRVEKNLRVEVDDAGTEVPHLREPELTASGGRGLLLIDTFTARWGCTMRGAGGKTVWFDLFLG